MRSRTIRTISAALLAATFLAPSFPAVAATSHTVAAAQFIDGIAARAVGILDETETDPKNRDARLRAILAQAFGLESMARTVVMRSWDNIEPVERERFSDLFGTFMLDNTVRLLDRHEPDFFEVTATKKRDDERVVVTTDVSRFGFTIAHIDWVVRGKGSDFRVIDIVLNKVSTVRTYQAEFGSVIRRKGFDGLLAALQSKTAE